MRGCVTDPRTVIIPLGVPMSSELNRLRKCFRPRQWFVGEGEPDPSILSEEETFMWVYRLVSDRYEVGYFTPNGEWFAESSYESRNDAAARVNYLNGGKS